MTQKSDKYVFSFFYAHDALKDYKLLLTKHHLLDILSYIPWLKLISQKSMLSFGN
jgi:hypothetical protein